MRAFCKVDQSGPIMAFIPNRPLGLNAGRRPAPVALGKSVGDSIARAAVLGLLGLLGGCATMTADECLYADWRIVGYEDGVQGRALAYLGQHRQACAKAGVTPDLDAYQAGRDDGIRVFCRPANAYQFGRDGNSYAGVCPDDSEDAFLAAYREGVTVFNLESAVNEVVAEIAGLDYRVEDAERRIADAHNTLENNTELTTEHRRRIREDIEILSRDIGRMEAERTRLLVELGARRERLREHMDAGR